MRITFILLLCLSLCFSLSSCNVVGETDNTTNNVAIENTDTESETNENVSLSANIYSLSETNFVTGRKTKVVAAEVKDGKLRIPLEGISYVRCFRNSEHYPWLGIDVCYLYSETIEKIINYFNSLDIPEEPSDPLYSLNIGGEPINTMIFYENDDVIVITLSGGCIAFDNNYFYDLKTWYKVEGQQMVNFSRYVLGIGP